MSKTADTWQRIRYELTGRDEALTAIDFIALALLGLLIILACLDAMLTWALAGLLLFFLLIPASAFLLVLALAVMTGFGVLMSEHPIHLSHFKVYGADVLLPFLGWMICLFLYRAASNRDPLCGASRAELLLSGLLFFYSAYGLFSAAYGLFFQGYPYDGPLGDYRRMCLYPMAFWLPIFLPWREQHLRLLKYSVLAGGCIVLCFAAYRYSTGNYWRVATENITGHLDRRLISDNEKLTLSTLAAYCSALVLCKTQEYKKIAGGIVLILALVFMFLSGWRLAIVYAVGVPIMAFAMNLWMRRLSFGHLVATLFAGGFVALTCGLLILLVFPDLYQQLLFTLQIRAEHAAVMGDERLFAWPQALAHWYSNPFIGVGIGHELVFYQLGNTGELFYSEGSTHNEIINVVYQMGIVGLLPFLLFHAGFVWLVAKHSRQVPERFIPIVIGLFIGYLCSFGSSMVEPVRVSQYIVHYLYMATVLGIFRVTGLLQSSTVLAPTPRAETPAVKVD